MKKQVRKQTYSTWVMQLGSMEDGNFDSGRLSVPTTTDFDYHVT